MTYAISHPYGLFLLTALLALLCGSPQYVEAQSQANTLSVDIGFSWLNDEVAGDLVHRERSYLLGIGYHLNPRWALRTQGTLIRSTTRSLPEQLTSAYLVGLTSQYDVLPESRHRFYLSVGAAMGNYCPPRRTPTRGAP